MRANGIITVVLLTVPTLMPLSAAEMIPVEKVVSSYMGEGLELAVTPTPQEAKLTDRMLVAGKVRIETRARSPHTVTGEGGNGSLAHGTPG
jgi:hypothetical protein